MEQINVKAKKWGNSFGVVIPKIIVEREKINEGTDLVISVRAKSRTKVKDLMEIGRRLGIARKLEGINTDKALKEVDEAFWSE